MATDDAVHAIERLRPDVGRGDRALDDARRSAGLPLRPGEALRPPGQLGRVDLPGDGDQRGIAGEGARSLAPARRVPLDLHRLVLSARVDFQHPVRDRARADHHIAGVEIGEVGAGAAGVQHDRRREPTNHELGGGCGVDHADAGADADDLPPADVDDHCRPRTDALIHDHASSIEQVAEFDLHRDDDGGSGSGHGGASDGGGHFRSEIATLVTRIARTPIEIMP